MPFHRKNRNLHKRRLPRIHRQARSSELRGLSRVDAIEKQAATGARGGGWVQMSTGDPHEMLAHSTDPRVRKFLTRGKDKDGAATGNG